MSDNDLIAEYIKEKYPELLNSADFSIYKLGFVCRKFVSEFKSIFDSVDFSKFFDEEESN